MPRMTKETAVSQCEKRSKRVETRHLPSGTSLRNPEPPEDQIGGAQSGNHAENHDRAEPAQYDFVEMIPKPSGGLNKNALSLIGLVDESLDAWRLLKQHLLAFDTGVRWALAPRQLLCEGRRCKQDQAGNCSGMNDEECARGSRPLMVIPVAAMLSGTLIALCFAQDAHIAMPS